MRDGTYGIHDSGNGDVAGEMAGVAAEMACVVVNAARRNWLVRQQILRYIGRNGRPLSRQHIWRVAAKWREKWLVY